MNWQIFEIIIKKLHEEHLQHIKLHGNHSNDLISKWKILFFKNQPILGFIKIISFVQIMLIRIIK